jgi:hypothetical protein
MLPAPVCAEQYCLWDWLTVLCAFSDRIRSNVTIIKEQLTRKLFEEMVVEKSKYHLAVSFKGFKKPRKDVTSGLESRKYGRRDPSR